MKVNIFIEKTTTQDYKLSIDTEGKSFEEINTICTNLEKSKGIEGALIILQQEGCKVQDIDRSPRETEIKVFGLDESEYIEEALGELA